MWKVRDETPECLFLLLLAVRLVPEQEEYVRQVGEDAGRCGHWVGVLGRNLSPSLKCCNGLDRPGSTESDPPSSGPGALLALCPCSPAFESPPSWSWGPCALPFPPPPSPRRTPWPS